MYLKISLQHGAAFHLQTLRLNVTGNRRGCQKLGFPLDSGIPDDLTAAEYLLGVHIAVDTGALTDLKMCITHDIPFYFGLLYNSILTAYISLHAAADRQIAATADISNENTMYGDIVFRIHISL